jgi:hypothetical protein
MANILILGEEDFFEEPFFDSLDELDITLMHVTSLRPYFDGVEGYTPNVILLCFTSNRLKDYDQHRDRGQKPYYPDVPVIAVFDMISWEDIGRIKADLKPETSFIAPFNEEDLVDRIEALL